MLPSVMQQPGDRAPAPPGLLAVQMFVNSVDLEEGIDQLATLVSARDWLAELDLPIEGLQESDLQLAIRVRESIRDLVDARDDPKHSNPAELGELVAKLDLRLRFDDESLHLIGVTPVGRTLAPIFDAIRAAIDAGIWDRLKVCERDVCRWLFYDHSKNHASRWCTSSICGSREKARRAYVRRTAASAPTANQVQTTDSR